jgi:hypothetical protein
MHFSSDQYQAFGSIVLGLGLIFWPRSKRREKAEQRRARLAELESRAPERYFEERRQLETYGPKSAGPFRLLGVLMLLIGVALFFVR